MTDEQVMRVVDEMMDLLFAELDRQEREIQRDMERKYCNKLVLQGGNGCSDVPQGAVVFNKGE